MRFAFLKLLHKDGGTKQMENKKGFSLLSFAISPRQSHTKCIMLPFAAHKLTHCLSGSAEQQHSTFTVQILYKL
jgi:hypothetical protein